MKIFVSIIMLLVFGSCGVKSPSSPDIPPKADSVIVVIEDTTRIESLQEELKMVRDSLQFYRDSIPYETYINARRIEKIKYYIAICDKTATNKKYFFGWIKRTMSE